MEAKPSDMLNNMAAVAVKVGLQRLANISFARHWLH